MYKRNQRASYLKYFYSPVLSANNVTSPFTFAILPLL